VPKSLKTNSSGWTKVFRRIVQQMETDPDFRRVVGVDRLRSWKGVPGDKAPFLPATGAPVVRLSPQPRNVDWHSPDTQAGTLVVVVEIAVISLCIDDIADLWDLIVQALRPGNGTLAQDLVSLGAETGEIVFSDPAFDPKPDAEPEGMFLASGRFSLRVLRSVNP
jgi:hypothetical protein